MQDVIIAVIIVEVVFVVVVIFVGGGELRPPSSVKVIPIERERSFVCLVSHAWGRK